MIEIPLIRDLHVLQLEQYWTGRYIKWVVKHWWDFSALSKTKLKETAKVKVLMMMYVFGLAGLYFLIIKLISIPVGVGVFVILNIWPVFVLGPIVYLVKEAEKVFLELVTIKKGQQIKKMKELITVGITGSWGKSSVKGFLFDILENEAYTVKTPESYNTILGVAKVIDLEIINKVKYFLAEMGAYKRGDIRQMVRMTRPQYGILTAVGKQHLDRFKTIKNITRTKFELVAGIMDKKRVLVNWDNQYIREYVAKNKKYRRVMKYSFRDRSADFVVSGVRVLRAKTKFRVKYRRRKYKFETELFGSVNVENLVAAIGMASMLGVPMRNIKKAVGNIKATKNRLEVKRIGRAIVVDNTFSSNVEGFEKMVNDLAKLKGKKVLVTPGIVELGRETKSIHQILGKKAADVFDEIVLVGESDRTRSLQVGIGRSKHKTNMWFLKNFEGYWDRVNELAKKYKWIVLENDLPENY